MKVLLAPYISQKNASASYFLTKNLAVLLASNGIDCAISTDGNSAFHQAAVYFAPKPKKPFFHFLEGKRSYEEWLYRSGLTNPDYLLDDAENTLDVIEHFSPNLIIAMDRPGAVIAARSDHIPCWAVVHSSLYKANSFPLKDMKGINEILSEYKLEQELDMKDFYARCQRRIGFGAIEAEPFPKQYDVDRFGLMSIYPAREGRTNRLCIFFTEMNRSPSTLQKLIEEAFLGAPYAVNAWYPGAHPESHQNIRTHAEMNPELIPGCIAVIHDGNAYVANRCQALGIPQLVITDHSYLRSDIALAAERNKYGTYLYEDRLTMSKLYETYRQMLSDDDYYYGAERIKKKTAQEGDLFNILNMIHFTI